MSKWYIGTDTGSKVLAHYAKGASAKDHKWVSRSLKNGHWVYVYDDSESGDEKSDETEGGKYMTPGRDAGNMCVLPDSIYKMGKAAGEEGRRKIDERWTNTMNSNIAQAKTALETQKQMDKTAKDSASEAKSRIQQRNAAKQQENERAKYDRQSLRDYMKERGIEKASDIPPSGSKHLDEAKAATAHRKFAENYDRAKKANENSRFKPGSYQPKVSKEYKEELEYNSRKNVFPEGFKTRPATAADADLFKNKSSAETKKKVTISDHGGNTGIKTEVTKKKKKRL